jgi:hypothetical protein
MSEWESKGVIARRRVDAATLCVIGRMWAVVPDTGAAIKGAEGMADGEEPAAGMAAADAAYTVLVEVQHDPA